MKFSIVSIVISCIALFCSCTADTHQFTSDFQQILPGKWQIESIQLQFRSDGITYQGNTFYHDTTLLDVGEIEFGSFGFREFSWDQPVTTSIAGNLKIENESFPFVIDELILSGHEIFGFFYLDQNSWIDSIDTPGEEFVSSAHLFNSNYWVTMTGESHIRLETFNSTGHVMEMEKIE